MRSLRSARVCTWSALQRVTYLILDEADRMLDMGYSHPPAPAALTVGPSRRCFRSSACQLQRMRYSWGTHGGLMTSGSSRKSARL